VLAGTDSPGISKLRVRGNVQLRPMLCCGPIDVKAEFTLLCGAKEIGGKIIPKDADRLALSRKAEVAAQPEQRRTPHVRT